MIPSLLRIALALLCCALAVPVHAEAAGSNAVKIQLIKPSATDGDIEKFDAPHVVVRAKGTADDAPLLVFLPGTSGKPGNLTSLLTTAALQGYRVIGLEYNNLPAAVVTCRRDPDPDCSAKFRQERLFGDAVSPQIDTPAAESVVNRLTQLLLKLGWKNDLRDGQPDWSRISIGGFSQGAGLAAFLAKQKEVARVVLFSSPWDFYNVSDKKTRLASWLGAPSATPPDRWYGAFHRREPMAGVLKQAYRLLQLPVEHFRLLDAPVLNPRAEEGENPYHGDTVRNPAYVEEWKFLLGSARAVASADTEPSPATSPATSPENP